MGTSKGLDTYTGEWKKGFPSGQGKYTYASGDVFEGEFKRGLRQGKGKFYKKRTDGIDITEGYWESGMYVGEKPIPVKYTVTRSNGIERIRCSYMGGEENTVLIKFTQNGRERTSMPEDLRESYSSGTDTNETTGSRLKYVNVNFPFHMSINFAGYYKMVNQKKSCEVVFDLNLPGKWEIVIDY